MGNHSKVAVVTGANSGLGLLIALNLKKEGYNIASCSRNEKIKDDSIFWSKVDVEDGLQVKEFIGKVIKKFNRIDVLVNNAGYVYPLRSIEDTEEDHLVHSFQTNVYGAFYFMREVIPIMKKQGEGKIISIASKAAVYPNPYLAVYSASKSAILTMTQSVAKQFRDSKVNIDCFIISPAGMNTNMRAMVYGEEDAKKQQDAQFVADTISNIINGNIIVPSGGNVIVKNGELTIREMQDG